MNLSCISLWVYEDSYELKRFKRKEKAIEYALSKLDNIIKEVEKDGDIIMEYYYERYRVDEYKLVACYKPIKIIKKKEIHLPEIKEEGKPYSPAKYEYEILDEIDDPDLVDVVSAFDGELYEHRIFRNDANLSLGSKCVKHIKEVLLHVYREKIEFYD